MLTSFVISVITCLSMQWLGLDVHTKPEARKEISQNASSQNVAR